MNRAEFRFYQELNDFLPRERRGVSFDHAFHGSPSVKDAVEALGVPHAEVDLILVDGESVPFTHHLCDGDRVAVYPVFESFDLTGLSLLRERPLREPAFVLDVHLGRLARYLRLLGFDCLYRNTFEDEEIIRIGAEEGRIILTRDLGILKSSRVSHGYWLRSQAPREQLRELFDRLDLAGAARPFTRCARCNGLLVRRAVEEIAAQVPARIRERCHEYAQCRTCGQLYWRGSHYPALQDLIEDLLATASNRPTLRRSPHESAHTR